MTKNYASACRMYWAVQKDLVKGCRQTLDCYCVICKLLSASKADALLFVNILVSGKFHGRFAQRFAVNKPCLQIVRLLLFVNMVCLLLIAEQNAHEICQAQDCLQIARHLIWKQTTTHSLRNNNPMFDGNLCPLLIDQPSKYKQRQSFVSVYT